MSALPIAHALLLLAGSATLFSFGFLCGGLWTAFHAHQRRGRTKPRITPMDPAAERDLAEARLRRQFRQAQGANTFPPANRS